MKKGHYWKRSAATSLALMVLLSSIASVSILLYPDNNQAEAVIGFDGMKNLSTNSGSSLDPSVSASGNNVYVVWSDNTPGNNEIILRASTDGGETFSSESKGRLTNTISASLSPKVSSSGNHVYAVWIEKDNSGKSDLHFRGSYNSGSSFGDIKNISNSGAAAEAQIAASGNNIYVVWSDAKSGNSDIYFSSSSDGGQSFGTLINLSDNAGISNQPQIVATVDGHVYVVWRDSISGSKEILLRASDNSGMEFGSIKNLSNNGGSSGNNPEIAASESSVYVTWIDNTAGNVEVFFAASTNAGSSFGSAVNLSNTAGASYRAQIAASGDKVYVTWRDTPREVYIRVSEDAGNTFSESLNLSNDETDSGWPEISATADNVYLVWRAGPLQGLSKEVYIRTSEDNGNFFDEVINLSNNPGNSGPPQVTSGSGRDVYVVWSDATTGSGDIYFRRGS